MILNILDARDRYRAAATHLTWSAAVAALAATMVFALWYPWPYRLMSGGQELFLLVTGVDLVMGPLLTLVVFNPLKARKVMRRDLIVIVSLQLAALVYGLHTVYVARPVAMVFENSRFRVVSVVDVVKEELPDAPVEVRTLSLDGPVLLGTRQPKDSAEQLKSIDMALAGIDIGRRPSFWQPYALSKQAVLKEARPLDAMAKQYPASAQLIEEAAARSGRKPAQLKFVPIIAMRGNWSALVDAQSGDVVGYIPLEGFF